MLYQNQYVRCKKCNWTGAPSAAAQSNRSGALCPVCFSPLESVAQGLAETEQLAQEFGIDQKGIYHPKEVASVLGVNEDTVCRWVRSGKLKAVRVGREYIIKGAWLLQCIAENKMW